MTRDYPSVFRELEEQVRPRPALQRAQNKGMEWAAGGIKGNRAQS